MTTKKSKPVRKPSPILYLFSRKTTKLDEIREAVVAAYSETEARKLLAAVAQDEGKALWLDGERGKDFFITVIGDGCAGDDARVILISAMGF